MIFRPTEVLRWDHWRKRRGYGRLEDVNLVGGLPDDVQQNFEHISIFIPE
jgi:hypothetical protein